MSRVSSDSESLQHGLRKLSTYNNESFETGSVSLISNGRATSHFVEYVSMATVKSIRAFVLALGNENPNKGNGELAQKAMNLHAEKGIHQMRVRNSR
jgi:hypothetical protein